MAPCRFRSALVSEVDGWLCSVDVFTGCIASCREDGTDGRCAAAPTTYSLTPRRSVHSMVSCLIKVISPCYSCTQLNPLVESVFSMSVEGWTYPINGMWITQPFQIKTWKTQETDKIIKLTHEVLSIMKDIKRNRANIQLNILEQVIQFLHKENKIQQQIKRGLLIKLVWRN